ncbi:hypothetical protein [Chryseolinea lacunae]|uniref:Lipocalin-like domain-containing protein n=1 Tax=Chryseolinea lacunae TaxID=2801331 RepID=A0ABS1KWN0_9BACT|nr:hypothetical protein [Chryseolinea lacunae]MBL0743850.1 hypothetical protein [Chryseolinea lacunae]
MLLRKSIAVLILSTVFTTLLMAQNAKNVPDKIIASIVGSWKVSKIVSGKEDVAKNPTSGQWIEFRSDGTYVNHATSLDSGSYRLNENQALLYLESHVKPGVAKDSPKLITEYTIVFKDETMILQRKKEKSAKGGQHVDKMKYYYQRVGEESSSVK